MSVFETLLTIYAVAAFLSMVLFGALVGMLVKPKDGDDIWSYVLGCALAGLAWPIMVPLVVASGFRKPVKEQPKS